MTSSSIDSCHHNKTHIPVIRARRSRIVDRPCGEPEQRVIKDRRTAERHRVARLFAEGIQAHVLVGEIDLRKRAQTPTAAGRADVIRRQVNPRGACNSTRDSPKSAAKKGAPGTAQARTRVGIMLPNDPTRPRASSVLTPAPHPVAGPASTQYVNCPPPNDTVTPASGVASPAGSDAANTFAIASPRPAWAM